MTPPGRSTGALAGLVVADFTRVLAGPLATMTLGDLGADVIKVERPRTGDETRWWGPPWVGEDSTYFVGLNRNKRSLQLDLGDDEDCEVARRLATRADVLVENFRPGTMARHTLGWDDLHAINPRLVYCSITAYGSHGAASSLPGYDVLLQAVSGLMSVTGDPEGPPHKVGVALLDMVCGLYAVVGIQAALVARTTTGVGQHVELSLFDCALAGLLNQASGYLNGGEIPGRLGNRHPSIAPYEVYTARDRPFVVAVGNDETWRRLCEVLACHELADDPRFAHNSDRVAHIDELGDELGAVFSIAPADHWIALLSSARIPCGPINNIAEAFSLAEQLDIDSVASASGPGGTTRTVRSPIRLSANPVGPPTAPPAVGEHSDEIRRWLQGGG